MRWDGMAEGVDPQAVLPQPARRTSRHCAALLLQRSRQGLGAGCAHAWISAAHGRPLESNAPGPHCVAGLASSGPGAPPMNAPDPAVADPEPHVMHTYGRLPLALAYGRGV